MSDKIIFSVKLAGHVIGVSVMYESTRSFLKDYLADEEPEFSVSVVPEDIQKEREKSEREALKEGHEVYRHSDAYLETLALYRKIADGLSSYDVLLFHGSASAMDHEAYIFTAKSGTGKSTHTRLWRKAFGEKVFMVNDDKPLLKITEDGVYVCGTPWNGKHRMSTNTEVKLKRLCILERAAENHIEKVEGEALRKAYPLIVQQTYRSSDPAAMMKTMSLIDELIQKVPVYRLGCNMDPEAAYVAYEGMNREETV